MAKSAAIKISRCSTQIAVTYAIRASNSAEGGLESLPQY